MIGLGTQLDTIRFCSLIAEQLGAPPTQTKAVILGEHGESMVPIWSSATIAGLPLDKYPGWNASLANQLFTRTRGSGAEVIKRKGGAGFAVGIAIRDVIESIALDRRSRVAGQQRSVGVLWHPRRGSLGANGRRTSRAFCDRMEIDLWPKEMQGMRSSGAALRKTLEVVLSRVA